MSAAPAIHSGARKSIPEQSENLHLSRSAANSDIPIKQLSPNTLGQIDGGKTDYFLFAFISHHQGHPPLSNVGVGSNWTHAQVDPNRPQCFVLEPTAEVTSSRRNSAS